MSQRSIPEQLLCNTVKILDILKNGYDGSTTPVIPGIGVKYRIEWISEQLLNLSPTVQSLTVPQLCDFCEIEIKGVGTVLKRMEETPTLDRSNQFNQGDLFSLTSRSEMIKSMFVSTTTNALYVNYFKLVLDI